MEGRDTLLTDSLLELLPQPGADGEFFIFVVVDVVAVVVVVGGEDDAVVVAAVVAVVTVVTAAPAVAENSASTGSCCGLLWNGIRVTRLLLSERLPDLLPDVPDLPLIFLHLKANVAHCSVCVVNWFFSYNLLIS